MTELVGLIEALGRHAGLGNLSETTEPVRRKLGAAPGPVRREALARACASLPRPGLARAIPNAECRAR